MDINDVNIGNVNALTAEDRAKINRQAVKNVLSFIGLKFFIYASIAALYKTLANRADKKK